MSNDNNFTFEVEEDILEIHFPKDYVASDLMSDFSTSLTVSIDRDTALKLCADLVKEYNIRCPEIAEAMNIPDRECNKEG